MAIKSPRAIYLAISVAMGIDEADARRRWLWMVSAGFSETLHSPDDDVGVIAAHMAGLIRIHTSDTVLWHASWLLK